MCVKGVERTPRMSTVQVCPLKIQNGANTWNPYQGMFRDVK
jgi:hypothetical protein